jgi:LuxR family maltose regulon positive regulatory protein
LLATKLYVPQYQPGFTSRPRLVGQLEDGLARGVVLVSAPAGFGKTSLLADWARTGQRPVAWLSLDAGDNDPARFWRHVAAALDRARPSLAARTHPLLGSPAPRLFEALVTVLINELVAQSPDGHPVLVLDDYHLIAAETVHASVMFLLEHRPPGLGIVLASRSDPPLALARLRARGQLAELRIAELRFTTDEAADLLSEALSTDVCLPASTAGELAARTEGWAAGLQLAAISLRARPDVDDFLATFSGTNRYVLDFLTEEVLERQPDSLRQFLLDTSILERLSGELCDALTGGSDGQRTLAEIERANLFLVPLDQARRWWRYHQLFADLLRARLEHEQPDRVAALHRAAAAWHARHGLADDAVRHALAARDAVWAARLIEEHVDALMLRSEGATLERWLAALPVAVVASRPRLLLARSRLALLAGNVGPAAAALDAAEQALPSSRGTADEPLEPSVGRASSLLAHVPAAIALTRAILAELAGDAEGAFGFASAALAALGDEAPVLAALIRGHLAIAEWLRGRLEPAERLLTDVVAQCRAADEPSLAAWGSHLLGQVQRAEGRLDAAIATYRQVLADTTAARQPALPAAGVAYVGMAEVAYQRGELDAALRLVADGIACCRQLAYTPPLAAGLATLAWVRQASGDVAGARDAVEEAQQVAPSTAVVNLLNPVPAQHARLLLAQGDPAAATCLTETLGLSADDEPRYPREAEYLVLARLRLAQGRADEALGLLERPHAAAAADGRTASLIEIQALRGLALAAAGETARALATLAEALRLASPQSYVRVFADEGAPMTALLRQVVSAQRTETSSAARFPSAYLGRLARAFEPEAARTPAVPALVEPLSERELEVLRLLAAGKPNQAIAEDLYVSLSTVKKHVTHVLGKLGVTNRTEATARARQLGVLQ